jgi:hypothetical protein
MTRDQKVVGIGAASGVAAMNGTVDSESYRVPLRAAWFVA